MSIATTFRLERPDGTPANPATFETIELNWNPGDEIFLGRGRTLRVLKARPAGDDDEERVLVVEPTRPKRTGPNERLGVSANRRTLAAGRVVDCDLFRRPPPGPVFVRKRLTE